MKNKLLSALIDAITHNQTNRVARLLKRGADPNACEDELLFSPLHYAAAHSNVEIAQLLLAAGAKLEAKDFEGFTPLETACLHNNRAFIRFYHDYQRTDTASLSQPGVAL
jgi:uncharacterized protein